MPCFGMDDRSLYQQILGLHAPWRVTGVELSIAHREVLVRVAHAAGHRFACPHCQRECPIHDHRSRRWRHLDTCQLRTVLEAEVPRVDCSEHGVIQVHVPWAEPHSNFTALFEAMVLSWLREASIAAVADLVVLSWDQVDGIMQRAVDRGLARRRPRPVAELGVDETSFQKRHEYVTIILDRDRDVVLEVLDDRTKAGLRDWLSALPAEHRAAIRHVSMDMYAGYIEAVRETLPAADDKICFDRFHVAQHFGDAVSKVRVDEHRRLLREHGESPLAGTRHDWLRSAVLIDNRSRREFMDLTRMNLSTARAWAIKETAASLWDYACRTRAEKAWTRLLGWVSRCRLQPVMRVGRMVKTHLRGIINAIIARVSNARSEAKNGRIQKIKAMACGFRSRARFRRAILFHLGGLDLMPSGGGHCRTHTGS